MIELSLPAELKAEIRHRPLEPSVYPDESIPESLAAESFNYVTALPLAGVIQAEWKFAGKLPGPKYPEAE